MTHISPLTLGIARRNANEMTDAAIEANRDAERAWNEVTALKLERNEIVRERNAVKAHFVAKEAENEYLLGLLDEVYGQEHNPARKKAYKEDTNLRIPTGDRKGEIPEVRDHIFYTAMKERFEASATLCKKYKNWFDVICKVGIFN